MYVFLAADVNIEPIEGSTTKGGDRSTKTPAALERANTSSMPSGVFNSYHGQVIALQPFVKVCLQVRSVCVAKALVLYCKT